MISFVASAENRKK